MKLFGYITSKHNPKLGICNNELEKLNISPDNQMDVKIKFILREVKRSGNFKYKFEMEING